MSEMTSKQLAEHWISELQNPCKTLTAWEQNFIESVSDQLDRRGTLSTKQMDILEDIYARKTA